MNWLLFIVGLIVGGGLAYLYFRYWSNVYKMGQSLLARAKGDFEKAWQHVGKL